MAGKKMCCQHENCEKYGLLQPDSAFFLTNNKLIKRLPICKKCISENLDLTKMNDIFLILQLLDYPYLHKEWEKIAEEHPDSVLSRYVAEIRKNALTKSLHFSDTEKMVNHSDLSEATEVTVEMRRLFGDGFTSAELIAMWNKYNFLKTSYDETTTMHTEFLINYVQLRVKSEMAIAQNNVDEAKKWSSMSKDAALAAGLTPNQMNKADLIGGITTFGELTQIIEENANGVIPLLPQFKFDPLDAVDFNIYCYLEYCRHLEGKEPCSYEDVYKFYDKKKADYIEKTGDKHNIFRHDPTESNREKVAKFIKMPDENEIGGID